MNLTLLTPGTGYFYCGTCLRDHMLTRELRRLGHEALMVPLYLPLVLETDARDTEAYGPFMGGINLYLQQTSPLFRRTPRWIDRLLDSRALLRWASRRTGMTRARDLGRITISMLQGEEGRQVKELNRLVHWLEREHRGGVVCLSNCLLAGLARQIRKRLGVPVICTLQGEDSFLDGLEQPYRDQAWQILADRCVEIDAFISVSRYYGDLMTRRLGLAPERVHVVLNGIDLEGFGPADKPPTPPVLGYLARMCPAKGLGTLVDAFLILKRSDPLRNLKLHIGGAVTRPDEPFVRSLQQRLEGAGLLPDVTITPNLDRRAKLALLRNLSVFSVPATYGEAFGLYVLEALASGVPTVQPRHGAFEELLGATGGGMLCEPDDPAALARAIEDLLHDEDRRRALAEQGRTNVLEHFGADRMARQVAEICTKVRESRVARRES